MPQTPREVVRDCLTFNSPSRIPRQTWVLPWMTTHHPDAWARLQAAYPDDFGGTGADYRPSGVAQGDPYKVGLYVDDWGCRFENIHEGVIGEVKDPVIEDLDDWRSTLRPPYETLPEDRNAARDTVNRACSQSDRFMMGGCCPRPWERLQFLRGTVNAMMDVMAPEDGAGDLIKAIHDYYMTELEFWVSTDVDAVMFMDDWGSQQSLLIPPPVWRDLFKPLYRDYCELAHSHGKFAFMHSDGCIQEVYTDLAEVGVDAQNSQLFTMDLDLLARTVKGRITFWGEIDRQHVLVDPDPEVARRAVRRVAEALYDPRGGIIAQFELGPGANPDAAFAIHDEWERVHSEHAR